MSTSEAEAFVLSLLKSEGPLTTGQIELKAKGDSKRCPDQTVVFLAKMRRKGIIRGEVSYDRGGWLWSLP